MAKMTAAEAMSRAAGVFSRLVKDGIMPFDDVGWMNPEDKMAIIAPFAAAILKAAQGEAGDPCPHRREDCREEEDGTVCCRLCGCEVIYGDRLG